MDINSNNSFFHKVMRERRRHNHIGPISFSGSLLESVSEVKEEVWGKFLNKFVESVSNVLVW